MHCACCWAIAKHWRAESAAFAHSLTPSHTLASTNSKSLPFTQLGSTAIDLTQHEDFFETHFLNGEKIMMTMVAQKEKKLGRTEIIWSHDDIRKVGNNN